MQFSSVWYDTIGGAERERGERKRNLDTKTFKLFVKGAKTKKKKEKRGQ